METYCVLGDGEGASFGELVEKVSDDSAVCMATEMVGVGSNEEDEYLLVSSTASAEAC